MALAALIASPLAAGAARADDYAAFGPARPVVVEGLKGDAMEPFVSRDGRYLFFNNRNDPGVDTNLFYAERTGDDAFAYKGMLAGADGPSLDGVGSLDGAGTFYFVSTRNYFVTLASIYRGAFSGGRVQSPAIALGVSRRKLGFIDFDAEISADGQTLYLAEGDFRGDGPKPKSARIVIARRDGERFQRRTEDEALFAAVNTDGLNYAPSISADGLELFFTRVAAITPTAKPQIWRATRPSVEAPFGTPQRVAAAEGFVEAPSLSADGHRLYFHRRDDKRFVLYEADR